MIAVAAGEAENPRKNIPKACRRVFWRILFFYVLGSLAIGVLVPYTSPDLSADGLLASPWVIAIKSFGLRGLPSVINAVIFTSACSSGNAFLYSASRYLFALAQNGQAPKFLLTCTKKGIPIYAVILTACISALTYLSCGSGAAAVFNWMLNLTTVGNLFTWCSILLASIRFQAHIKAQGVSRDSMPMKSPFQPYTAWFALIFFSLIIIFNGWKVFTAGNWSTSDFITAYIGIPIYFALYIFWKVFKGTKMVRSSEADLWTGKSAIDSEIWPDHKPTTVMGKVWDWIA
jgi:amino acid transporter